MVGMMWKSTSSSGWEYLNCVRGLGFEYITFVLLFYYLNLCNYVLVWYDVWIGFVKHETWIGWIGGVITLWLNGYGFKPWRTKLKILFLAFWLWIEYERLGKNPR